MPRYAVILDTSWACNSYDEIVVEAETAAKAKYKAANNEYAQVFTDTFFSSTPAGSGNGNGNGNRGEIISDGKEQIAVVCSDGLIEIRSMQMAGKKRMSNKELLLGFRNIEDYTM